MWKNNRIYDILIKNIDHNYILCYAVIELFYAC
jgi:hypothetical protein